MILSNKVYDSLKWVTLVLIPALATFYLALAQSWNLPFPTEVAATLAAIDVFLAALIGVSSSNYKIRVATLNFNLSEAFGKARSHLIIPKEAYDILTWIAQTLLPAFAALYFALAGVWGLPFADQVVATVMAIDTFLGMILGLSSAQFHKQVALDCIDVPAGVSQIIEK